MPHRIETVTVACAAIRLFRGGVEGGGAMPVVSLHRAGGHTGWMAFLEHWPSVSRSSPEHDGNS
jgi:hypothetical protein